MLIAFAAVAVGIYVLHYTRFGRNVYAIGGNAQSALLMGLPVGRTRIGVYTVSGFCSALRSFGSRMERRTAITPR